MNSKTEKEFFITHKGQILVSDADILKILLIKTSGNTCCFSYFPKQWVYNFIVYFVWKVSADICGNGEDFWFFQELLCNTSSQFSSLFFPILFKFYLISLSSIQYHKTNLISTGKYEVWLWLSFVVDIWKEKVLNLKFFIEIFKNLQIKQ